MSDTVEQIKSRLDIVEIISGYLKVAKSGQNYKARCPFHNEKTPSFYISPERQSWHCFGCNRGGDMFSFVQEIEGIDFVESLRILAARAGVEMLERRPEDVKAKGERQILLAVTELSAKFFQKQLSHSDAGKRALKYLHERGLADETITGWRLGWAPNDWRALTGFLIDQGMTPASIVGAGMAIDKNGRPYDRFRSRIMFPINDANGQVVGFTGRVFGAEVAVEGEMPAKYVNTPQTAIYDKGRLLYGLDKAKTAMRSRDACLLVEGNMDAIMSSQAGAQHTVATSGTALTPHQLRLLGRYTTNLHMCFDADQAGQVATRRGIALALAQKFSVHILSLRNSDAKDPSEFVQQYGDKWNEVVASSKPALQYYFDEAMASFVPSSTDSKKAIIASMGPLIRRLTSKVEQGHWVGQIASLLRADQSAVASDIASVNDDITAHERSEDVPAATHVPPLPPLDITGQELLALLVRQPALSVQLAELTDVLDPRVSLVVTNPDMLGSAYDGEHRHLIDMAVIRASELWQVYTPEQLQEHMTTLVNHLRARQLRTLRTGIEREIRQAEADRDVQKLPVLLAKFQEYSTQLNQLQHIQTPTSTT